MYLHNTTKNLYGLFKNNLEKKSLDDQIVALQKTGGDC